jgi:hypothetical protein
MSQAKRTTIYITKDEMDDLTQFVPEDMAAKVAQWGFKRALEWAKRYGDSFVMDEIINDRKKYDMVLKDDEEKIANEEPVTGKKIKIRRPSLHVPER